ncbi:WG repeat-containing protein [Ferruginibacter sp.]|nr:WG repeat-containing protein [Ferruginibacter sp.]
MLVPFLLANNKYSFIDLVSLEIKNRSVQFDSAGFFKEGFSIVTKGQKKFFIDEHFYELKINEEYIDIEDFYNGLAIIKNMEACWCINKSGHKIHTESYSLIRFREDDFIDIIAYEYIDIINQGEWWGREIHEEKYGLMDKSGNILLEPSSSYPIKFYNNIAIVKIGGDYKIMDRAGKLGRRYYYISPFNEPVTGAIGIDKLCYIINKEGEILHEVKCLEISSFKCGLALVKLEYSIYSFCDLQGKIVDYTSNNSHEFYQGFRVMHTIIESSQKYFSLKQAESLPHKYALIDTSFKLRTGWIYDYIEDFNDGYAVFKRDSTVGYIDENCIEVFTNYSLVESFNNGYALVSIGDYNSKGAYFGLYGIIDTRGNKICPIIYDSCTIFNKKYFLVEQDNKKGIVDIRGSQILDCVYDNIIEEYDDLFYVESDNKKFVVSEKIGEFTEFNPHLTTNDKIFGLPF